MFEQGESTGGGVLDAMGLRSMVPEGWEAPDVGGWMDEHPGVMSIGQDAAGKVAGSLAALAIGAMLKRYLAKRARLKLAEAEHLAKMLGPTEPPAYQSVDDLFAGQANRHQDVRDQQALRPFMLRSNDYELGKNLRQTNSLADLLWSDDPYRDKLKYGR